MIGRKDPVSAGRVYEFRCQAVGARPPPEISWWRGSTQIRENVTNKVRKLRHVLPVWPVIIKDCSLCDLDFPGRQRDPEHHQLRPLRPRRRQVHELPGREPRVAGLVN